MSGRSNKRKTQKRSGCPPETPYVCRRDTIARGLCVPRIEDCDRRINGPRPVPIYSEDTAAAEKGASYGYGKTYLGLSCYLNPANIVLDYEATFDGEPIPETFSLLTYNIWGLAAKPRSRHLFGLRKDLLVKTILDVNADLCFFQEMSAFAYTELKDTALFHAYPFKAEEPYPSGTSDRRRGVDTYCLTRYRPSRVRQFGIEGVLNYKNALMIVEFPNLVVYNLYSQAGSRDSPGQRKEWLHYSRCRYDILQSIYDIMMLEHADKRVILCGDFNFDLDGARNSWPETAMLQRFLSAGFVDTFRSLNPTDPGYTEDTVLNVMRWNQKFIEKFYRFDGIFSKGLRPKSSRIIGTETALLNKDQTAWFIEHMSDKTTEYGAALPLRGLVGDLLEINPSDHFGVLTLFGKNRSYRTSLNRR